MDMEYKDKLRTLRQERGLTQVMLAYQVGRSAETIISWEKGRTRPPEPVRRLLAQVLGVLPEFIDPNIND